MDDLNGSSSQWELLWLKVLKKGGGWGSPVKNFESVILINKSHGFDSQKKTPRLSL